jgi:hypothetical protein
MAAITKRRVNLYLDKKVYGAAQELSRKVPGTSVSDMVNELLAEAVPMYQQMLVDAERVAAEAEARGEEPSEEFVFSQLLAGAVLRRMAGRLKSIHTLLEDEGGEQQAA